MIAGKIITGGDQAARLAKAGEIFSRFLKKSQDRYLDLEIFESEASITIAEIRRLKKWMSLKPYLSSTKIALIKAAEKLTLQAQNALLKTLEEPTQNTIILLETGNLKLLLPTIISRSEIIPVGQQKLTFPQPDYENAVKIIKSLTAKSSGERLKMAQELVKGKKSALNFVILLLSVFRQELKEKPSARVLKNLKLTQQTYKTLEANSQPILALGNLFFDLS